MLVFQMDGDNPKGISSLSGDTAPAGTLECTQAQADQVAATGVVFPCTSIYRWTYISNVLEAVTDTRPSGTFALPGGSVGNMVNGNATFSLDIGDPEPTVKIEISAPAGTYRPVFNGIDAGYIKVVVAGGEAEIAIKTDVAREFEVSCCDLIQLTNKLRVRVSETKF